MIFGTVGGLGLFLFGMGFMSDGLKKVAGQKLKSILESLTKNRIIAVLMGMLTTALIQSSSATTVMTVGFVNAGLLTLKQALCVVLGANVGTTITAGLVSVLAVFKITNYALPSVGVGFVIMILGKTQKSRSIGQVLIGFGLLFLGIHFMKEAFDPLRDHEGVQQALIWLGDKPILAVLAGTLITMLLQSSSASITMIQMLAFQGAFGTDWNLVLRVAIPFILGDNIGTTITAQLASLRSSRNAKRAAMGHTIFNLIGVMYMIWLVYASIYSRAVIWITPGELNQETIMRHIFFSHLIFNVFNMIVFLPFVNVLETIVLKILPITEAERVQEPVVLEKHLLDTPVIGLVQQPETAEILGVRAEAGGKVIAVKANRGVILTCGGFAGNPEMLSTYIEPAPVPIHVSGTPYCTGDGVKMVIDAGADLWHMNALEWGRQGVKPPELPAVFWLTPKKWSWINVNRYGKRFRNEDSSYGHTKKPLEVFYYDASKAEWPNHPWYMIFDEKTRKAGPIIMTRRYPRAAPFGTYNLARELHAWSIDNSKEIQKGWINQAETLSELADKTGLDPKGLQDTVAKYNDYCQKGSSRIGWRALWQVASYRQRSFPAPIG